MGKKKRIVTLVTVHAILILLVFTALFPIALVVLNSFKPHVAIVANPLSWPESFIPVNYSSAWSYAKFGIGFKNSIILTAGSLLILILAGSMAGYVLQRRSDRTTRTVDTIVMTGLMIPPAILPTIWVMQGLHIYKTMFGMILVETALQIPFTIMLYKGFMNTIPVELEEAGYIDGCTRGRMFVKVIFPLLKPVTSTIIILNAVTIFNDFTNPLYFLPGNDNVTVQLTLYNFMGRYSSSYNLLFADVLIITVPMLILFLIFNKKIVDGMVAGAVKG